MASWPPPQYGDDPRRQQQPPQQQYDPNAVYVYAAAPVQPQYVYATPPPPVTMHHHHQQQQPAPQWGLPYVPSANWTDDTQSTTTYTSTPSNYDGYGSPNDTSSSGDSSNESSSSSSSPVKSDSSGSQIVKSKKRAYHDVPADHTGARNSPIYGLLPPKHSYQSQKEERDALAEEVKRLQARVEELRQRAGLPTANDKAIVASVQARNFDFEENIHATRLHIGRMHSMVTRELLDTQLSPLSTFIHLPSDPSERTALLRAMRELKLRRAHEAAVSFLELNEPSSRIERYTAPDARHHCNCFAVDVYEGLQDARQLYDALLLFFSSLEVHVTQATGQLAMRDHDPDGVQEIDPSVWHQRIVTSADEATNTIGEEINAVGFTRFLGRQHDAQLGVIAYDTVDMDDLYPYTPLERTRKDIHACYVVTECPKPNATRGETLVVLKRCMFITQHPPTFPVTPAALENLHEHMPQWFDVMTKYLKARMAAERSPG